MNIFSVENSLFQRSDDKMFYLLARNSFFCTNFFSLPGGTDIIIMGFAPLVPGGFPYHSAAALPANDFAGEQIKPLCFEGAAFPAIHFTLHLIPGLLIDDRRNAAGNP